MAAGHIAREIMCSVLVRERPGGVGHCLATTRDENGCVRDCVSVWSKISKISNCLGIPTNTKRSNRIHLGGDFDSQHAILKKQLSVSRKTALRFHYRRPYKCRPTQVLVVQSRHEFRSTLLAQSLVRSRARRVVHTALRHSGTTLQLASCASADGRAVHVIEDWRRLLLL